MSSSLADEIRASLYPTRSDLSISDRMMMYFAGHIISTGSPEGVVTADVGSEYMDISTGTKYYKVTGSGNTGWIANATATDISTKQDIPNVWVPVVVGAGPNDFVNSWSNFDSSHRGLRYRKNGTDVELEGLIHGGVGNTVVFTLPAGFRPANNGEVLFVALSFGGLAYIEVASSGTVKIQETSGSVNTYASLGHITFSTL